MRVDGDWNSTAGRYGAALLLTAGSILLRFALNPLLQAKVPFALTLVAVLVVTRYFGIGPAILAALTGGAACSHLFLAAGVTFPGAMISVNTSSYLLISTAAIWLMEMQRREHNRADTNARLASQRLADLQRETAERERQQEVSRKLQAIVESSEDAIVSKSLDGVVQSWNKAAERLFGYTSEEMVGKSLSPLLPAERVQEEADILERIRRSGRVKRFETVRLHKDGRAIPVSLTISPVHDDTGRVVGASEIGRDMTEQKQMEEQLRQTQKLESLGVLAGGLAHDFNNLLTGILGNASLAREELIHQPQQIYLGEIVDASERAALLVRQMLAYAGKGRMIVEPLDLSQQISEIVPLIRTSIPRTIELHLDLDAGLPVVMADRSQLQQLVMNLVINAAEAIGEQPGTVSIRTGGRKTDEEIQVVLVVSDTGCGMDETTRARMFDPFFTTKFTGRGLGLAAVLGIIRGHRGTISVDSEQGVGTSITVVLPASVAPAQAATPEESGDIRGYGNILVVDDEELVRNLAKFTLDRCGYTTELAADGREGVDLFARDPNHFSAVILDLAMPVMGGEEAVMRLRAIRPDVPILLSSGFSEEEAVRRFADKGVSGFLQKPYTATALARKLKHVLRGSRASIKTAQG